MSASATSRPRPEHTYGPQCRLAPVPQPEPESSLEGIPPINAQFFYAAPIPIDDPLSTTASASSTAADGQIYRNASRPFSQGDNNALEAAWLGLTREADRSNHDHAIQGRPLGPALLQANADKLSSIAQKLANQHQELHAHDGQRLHAAGSSQAVPFSAIPVCCPELPIHASNELREAFCAVTRETLPMLDEKRLVQDVMSRMQTARSESDNQHATRRHTPVSSTSGMPSVGLGSSVGSEHRLHGDRTAVLSGQRSLLPEGKDRLSEHVRLSIVEDDGLSGKPFVRVDTSESSRQSTRTPVADVTGSTAVNETPPRPLSQVNRLSPGDAPTPTPQPQISVDIPVGVSRLHLVSLPLLQMKPLYWSPVNDIAVVLRATWFDQATMTPLEPVLANQLEAGYRELRPWTETWQDEVRCAIDVGPLGEEKVAYQLWGDEKERLKRSRKLDKTERPVRARISSDPFCAARCKSMPELT